MCIVKREKILFIRLVCYSAGLLFIAAVFSGCQLSRPAGVVSFSGGAAVSSLSSNASLSYKSSKRSITGSGFLMYEKPDQMRMIVLSPFGSVLQEVFVSGEEVTIIDSGNGIAYRGSLNDLPDKGDFSAWRSVHWIFDFDLPDSSLTSATVERKNRFGELEQASFEKGLLLSKTTVSGGRVSYGKYTAVEGVAIPLEIRYETVAKESFVILFEEPEVNKPFAKDTFKPKLSKNGLFPLSILK